MNGYPVDQSEGDSQREQEIHAERDISSRSGLPDFQNLRQKRNGREDGGNKPDCIGIHELSGVSKTIVKKIPRRWGAGLKIPSLRWIREGQTLPAGEAEATIAV